MAKPTQPTVDSISLEALKKAGYPNISAGDTLQVRAEDWIEEIKQDIAYKSYEWKPLMTVSYAVTVKGQSRYAMPADFRDTMSVSILDGGNTGTCQAGANGTATLASDENFTTDFAQGKLLLITSGTGAGSCSQITNYNNTTKVATVTPDWTTNPDATSGYLVVETHYELEEHDIRLLDAERYPHDKQIPQFYFPTGQGNADDDETGELEMFPTPNDVYGFKMRYQVDLLLTDITSNLFKTLLRRWRHIFDQGVYYKALKNDRDKRAKEEEATYKRMLADLSVREQYGMNLSNLQASVQE